MRLLIKIINSLKRKPKPERVDTEADLKRRAADEELITVILPTINNGK